MDFYDSLLQYDLQVQNKITERINLFIKSINFLKNESLKYNPNTNDSKYNHINNLINEINSSNKLKKKLLLNQKKNLLIRMSNKTKVNSKYYIYAKDMNKDSQKIDIIEIEDDQNKRDSKIGPDHIKMKTGLEFEKCFNQKRIICNKSNDNENIPEEDKIYDRIKSDINKIVCDIIKQNVKNIYNKKINEKYFKKNVINKERNNFDNLIESKTINNNYIKIDLPKKEFYFKEEKDGKENKKINNNRSSDKNNNFIHYFNESKKKAIKKELRNSVTNNNANHLKIKANKNDILSFNNLNNNNINNLLIIKNKIKNAKNDNNDDNNNNDNNNENINNNNNNVKSKILKNENKMRQKEVFKYELENILNSSRKNNNNKTNDEKINNKNNNKNAEQSHKKLIIRNIQKIQIKNIILKNNPKGYNLTNTCNKKSELENFLKNNLKKRKLKKRQCASPVEIGLSNKKINILKFKLGKNEPMTNRKNTEKSYKNNIKDEINNENDNSIISIIDNKIKDIYSNAIRFNSVKKKTICENMSSHDLSEIYKSKKIKNNFLIRNFKTNINNYNNDNNINSFSKESENENYFIINRNNRIKKSLSKESGSHSNLPWNFENTNTNSIINKSNNKANIIESFLNRIKQIDKKNKMDNNLKNINEYKKINKNNNTNYIYNDKNLEIKTFYNEQKFEQCQIKKPRIKNIINNNNFKDNRNFGKIIHHDTINNRGEPISYREGDKINGKRRILSTRVHIRGINSSKNLNNIV